MAEDACLVMQAVYKVVEDVKNTILRRLMAEIQIKCVILSAK